LDAVDEKVFTEPETEVAETLASDSTCPRLMIAIKTIDVSPGFNWSGG